MSLGLHTEVKHRHRGSPDALGLSFSSLSLYGAGEGDGKSLNMKTTIAIVTNRQVQPKTLQSLLELTHNNKHHDLHFVVATEGFTTAQGRIYCAVQAQKNQSDYLLFVDDDMILEPDTLDRLLAHGKEIVGVNAYSRALPLSSTVGLMDKNGNYLQPDKHTEWEMRIPEGLFECFSIGTGVLLIDMKVFDVIEKPWFKFDMHDEGYMKQGEDSWFCSEAKKKGFKIYCDGSLRIGHIGSYVYQKLKEDFTTFLPSEETLQNAVVALVPPQRVVKVV